MTDTTTTITADYTPLQWPTDDAMEASLLWPIGREISMNQMRVIECAQSWSPGYRMKKLASLAARRSRALAFERSLKGRVVTKAQEQKRLLLLGRVKFSLCAFDHVLGRPARRDYLELTDAEFACLYARALAMPFGINALPTP